MIKYELFIKDNRKVLVIWKHKRWHKGESDERMIV